VLAPLVAGRRRRTAALSLSFAALLTAAVYWGAFAPASAIQRFTGADPTGSGRTDLWTIGWRIVQSHPLLGVGAGNFQTSTIHYLLQPGLIRFSVFIVDTPDVAHNIYLQVLAELGVVGLALFLTIVAFCVVCAARAAQRLGQQGDHINELLARGLLLAMIGLLVSDFFSSQLLAKQLWLLLATGPALLALAEMRGRAAVRAPAAAPRLRWRPSST
jgi:O-antigen ligase